MEQIVLTTLTAAALGTLAYALRIPPLVGFLGAGFLLGAFGMQPFPGLEQMADLGVVLLLFTIGLKFDLRSLLRREAYGTATIHLAVLTVISMGTVGLISTIALSSLDGGWREAAVVGFALSFSSTVLCVKVLEERSDDGSFYGQTAIAILVMQDIIAVGFLTANSDTPPSPWALLLVLLVPLSWVLRRVLDRLGHGELLVLFGVVMALGPGYFAFSSVGLKGDLGALVAGLLFSTHPRAIELSKSLFSVKELFLVGFFVMIGLSASPTWLDLGIAALLCVVLLPITFIGFVLLGRMFGLRNRTTIRTSLVLSNFSEFSIIVTAVGVSTALVSEKWLTIVAVAVPLSMVISSLVNTRSLNLTDRLSAWLPEQDPLRLRVADRPIDTSDADAVVLGMGRVGRAAYTRLAEEGELRPLGVDNDHLVVQRLLEDGYKVVEGDATDHEFWNRIVAGGFVRTVVLAMPIHDSNLFALEQLRAAGFDGRVSAVAQHPDQLAHLAGEGVGAVVNVYGGAGAALADATLELPLNDA
ncbi:cation:proton antiporter [Microbacterium esteraromaticum]|uniref:cation:proton antiporter family protein n=1 Tax=Microbacterium esteraromaticum TaxID=57043 RepID=UPI001A8EF4A5|nr:cation:proton antiporter family protein [Microbacterium esteraromaticum]MBN8425030.1 cation:proton antiporter [Microbacterium esteraromaticum]